MMDVYVELTKALVEMVKQGGTLAIWGIFVWMTLGIVKSGLLLGAVYLVIRLICNNINSYQCLKHFSNKEQVSLLSPKVSRRLEDFLKEYRDTTTKAMKDFIIDAQALLKSSKEQTKLQK
jgi:hypothetical protein